ncbi:hypothetical protein [Rhodosalinus sp. K401]|uniref:hypothetical protein n=1 Tax=Rhodosalinus sp. K401 TaxID=3239195 RepID=UPI0035255A7F
MDGAARPVAASGDGEVTARFSATLFVGAADGVEGPLLSALRRNTALLQALGIDVPLPRYYRRQFRALAERLEGAAAPCEELSDIWKRLRLPDEPRHGFFSDATLLGGADRLLGDGRLLPDAHLRPTWWRAMFGEIPCTLMVAVAQPLALVSAALARDPQADATARLRAEIASADPRALSWAEVIGRLVEANPGVPVVVWSREEQPYTWPVLMHVAAGLPEMVVTDGLCDGLADLLPAEALQSLETFLAAKDNLDPAFLAGVFEAYVDKFVPPEQLYQVISVPGWDEAFVRRLADSYERDLAALRRMPGVKVLSA